MKTYEGSCHCGAVKVRARGGFDEGMRCNCSICSRAGWVLYFIPEPDFELLSGDASLRDYQFGKEHLHHLFCETCGVRVFTRGAAEDGSTIFAVNARCLDGFDWDATVINDFDGAAI